MADAHYKSQEVPLMFKLCALYWLDICCPDENLGRHAVEVVGTHSYGGVQCMTMHYVPSGLGCVCLFDHVL